MIEPIRDTQGSLDMIQDCQLCFFQREVMQADYKKPFNTAA